MKVWAHVIAAVVGLALAALIVYLVFGNASEQGATQDGQAPTSVTSGESLCGTVTPAEGATPAARTTALKNPPSILDKLGREVVIDAKQPNAAAQRAWFARVHAAGGLCVDEVQIANEQAAISMSTVNSVSDADAAAFAGGAIASAFGAPLNQRAVKLEALVGNETRTVYVSDRAWAAFGVARRSQGLGTSVRDLVEFRKSGVNFPARDLRITGNW